MEISLFPYVLPKILKVNFFSAVIFLRFQKIRFTETILENGINIPSVNRQ